LTEFVTGNLYTRKLGVETVATGFTDHFAVVRLATDVPILERGRSYWKMNISLLYDKSFLEILQERWIKWQAHKRHYPNAVVVDTLCEGTD
jgi:hypothetical protein